MINTPCLQFITPNIHEKNALMETVHQVLEAGITWVQLRLKNTDTEKYTVLAKEVLSLTYKYNALLIINDYWEITQNIHAQGVHVGMQDTPTKTLKNLLSNKIIGGTANTFEDILYHIPNVDYIGLGPYRYTSTKKNLSPILGKEGYSTIKKRCQEMDIHTPLIAIGGIELEDIKILKECDIQGIAVSGAISNGNVYQNAKLWVEEFYSYFAYSK